MCGYYRHRHPHRLSETLLVDKSLRIAKIKTLTFNLMAWVQRVRKCLSSQIIRFPAARISGIFFAVVWSLQIANINKKRERNNLEFFFGEILIFQLEWTWINYNNRKITISNYWKFADFEQDCHRWCRNILWLTLAHSLGW